MMTINNPLVEGPVRKTTTKVFTKRISHRWGHELGDVSEYTIGVRGNSAWISGRGVDLSGPPDLLFLVAKAISEVLLAHESDTSIPEDGD